MTWQMRWNVVLIFTIVLIFINADVKAQWGAPYSNSWITYGKPYVKIAVNQKGLYRLPFSLLPKNFPLTQPEKMQLWHRGKQVAIVSLANSEVLFYGVPNDGASDSLFYRPMSSRMNPYWSMYSDESAYFLTIGEDSGLRSEFINKPSDESLAVVPYHRAKIVASFKDEYSLSTSEYLKPDFINSFFEIGASRTGPYVQDDIASNHPFKLTNLAKAANAKILIKLMIHGRSSDTRTVDLSVGKNAQSLRLIKTLNSTGFAGVEYSFEINSSDVDELNNGVLSLTSHSKSEYDRFSIAYYTISFPQEINGEGKPSYEFELEPSKDTWNRIQVNNPVKGTANILDISDFDRPKVISGQLNSLMVERKVGASLKLLTSNETILLKTENLKEINFSSGYPKSSDYIIITSGNLVQGATEYANYRASADGGSHKTLVVNINDLYDQFNFGEPSPIAIRRFADYMISEGAKGKYLYLIGNSITYNERMVRELPDEVPTVGFPGSDILLVEGLGGVGKDIPALPVGRLPAVSNQNVLDYLQKIKEYENKANKDIGWKKNVLHLNGGKSTAEITQLKNFLSSIAPAVSNGLVGGKVTPFVKQQGMLEVESVNITPEVNNGVGLITYFGHGSISITDLNFGYVTDVNRGYNNASMYPMMYFNGCGVGNIFSARNDPNPGSVERFPVTMDWILASKRGAIVIIANSFESYVEPSGKYLEQLYKYMFTDSATANLPIGDIQVAVSRKIVTDMSSVFNIANVHQSILQGDPAVKLISSALSDYAIDSDEGIRMYSESTDKTIGNSEMLKVKVYVQNLGRFIKTEKVPVEVIFSGQTGTNAVKQSLTAFAYHDTLSLSIVNEKDLRKIEVKIDPENTLKELNKNNNIGELIVDWEIAKKQNFYPQGVVKDIVAPLLKVEFNGKVIKNDESLTANPIIRLVLEDDRNISIDTSHVEVFIKPCANDDCDFKRLNYTGKNALKITSITNHALEFNYIPTELTIPGTYELLVTSRDDAGNTTTSPFKIRFTIVEEGAAKIQVIASPNPATSYVRFESTVDNSKTLSSIEWIIYNFNGAVIERHELKSPFNIVNEWYWKPQISVSGFYFYKVNFRFTDSGTSQTSGKLIMVR